MPVGLRGTCLMLQRSQGRATTPARGSGSENFWKVSKREQEEIMKVKKLAVVALLSFRIISLLGPARLIQAQVDKAPYPTMAPLEQYMMARDAEIALARSAAPDSVSRDATVLVLGRHGYETAVEGKNGFVCMVERGWFAALDAPEFCNPKIRGADCLNPQAARSILPLQRKRTEMFLAGESTKAVLEAMRAAYAKKEFPAMEPGAIGFMMSKDSYLTDGGAHNL